MLKENNSKLTSVASSDTIQQAAERMRDFDCQCLSVRDADNQAIGSVSARDIVLHATALGDHPESTPVAAVMTTQAIDDQVDVESVGDFGQEHVELTRYGHAPDLLATS